MAPELSPDQQIRSDPRFLKRRSVHGAAVTFGAQIGRFAFQFGSQIFLAHLIAPAEFGVIAMVAPIINFTLRFNQLGLLEATIQRKAISQRELSALFWINLSVSVLLALLIAAAAPLVGWFYGEPRTVPVAACLASLVVLGGFSAQPMALLNRRMEFLSLAAIDLASTATAAVVGIAMAWLDYGYWALVMMQAANSAAVLVLAWALAGWRPSWPRWERDALGILRFGGNVTGFNIVDVLSRNLDNVAIGAAWGNVAVGLYDRTYRLMLLPLAQITTTFARVAVPLLSRSAESVATYRRAYLRMLQTTLLITTPAIVSAIVLAHPLLVALLGRRWGEAAPIFAWLGLRSLAYPVINSATWLFISQGRAQQQLIWGTAGAALIVLSVLAGLPWGALGVARSTGLVTCLVQVPLLCWAVTREGPIRMSDYVRAGYPFVLAGLASACAISLLASRAGGHLSLPKLAGFVALSYAVHAAVLACLPHGNVMLREIWGLRTTFRRAAA